MFMKLSNRDAFGHPLKFRSAKDCGIINVIPRDQLVAEWLLTANANDTGGGSYNGTLYDDAVIDNGSLLLDGNADFMSAVAMPGDGSLSFGDGVDDSPMTLSAYININAIGSGFEIISKGATNQREYRLYVNGSGVLCIDIYDPPMTGYIYAAGQSISAYNGSWVHVLATYAGDGSQSSINLYANNTEMTISDSGASSYTAMDDTEAPLIVGRYYQDGSIYANGRIKLVRMYKKVLTTDERTALYNEGQ